MGIVPLGWASGPHEYVGAVYLPWSLVAFFRMSMMPIIGLRVRHHIEGAISMIMTGLIRFSRRKALSDHDQRKLYPEDRIGRGPRLNSIQIDPAGKFLGLK